MILAFRYRLLPSKRQHRVLEQILELQRELYNAALQERIGAYQKAGISRSFIDQAKELTVWRREDADARAWPLNIQRATLKRLDNAFNAFFRRLKHGGCPGFPRFKGKGRFQSFGFKEFRGVSLKGARLRFQGMPGGLRLHLHRPMPDGVPRSCFVKQDAKGWMISLLFDVVQAPRPPSGRVVGIDLGVKVFAALSDGGFIPSLRAARHAERRLARLQRALSRKSGGSRNRAKARNSLARLQARIARRRNDHLHKASRRLVREYDAVAIESLRIKALSQGRLAKDVHDASWARFISMLRYKAESAGVQIFEVSARGTSQECSDCGKAVPKTLKERLHWCPHCGLMLDRDLNAARNVLNRASMGPGQRNALVSRGVLAETSALYCTEP